MLIICMRLSFTQHCYILTQLLTFLSITLLSHTPYLSTEGNISCAQFTYATINLFFKVPQDWDFCSNRLAQLLDCYSLPCVFDIYDNKISLTFLAVNEVLRFCTNMGTLSSSPYQICIQKDCSPAFSSAKFTQNSKKGEKILGLVLNNRKNTWAYAFQNISRCFQSDQVL